MIQSVNRQISKPANWALIFILLLAAFLRLYRLDDVPPGLTHDEADTGYFVAAVYRGAPSPVEAPYGYAYEPLPMYSGAVFMALFGPTDLALRLHSAFFGMVLLFFTYLWARRLFGVKVGLGSAALVGVSFWTVCDSRFALNSQPAPALFTGAVYFLWLAIDDQGDKRRWWAWGLFALLLAGSFYVYEAVRAAAFAFGLLFVYLACFDRPRFRRHGAWFAGALVVAGLLAAPHLLDPNAWGRTSTLSGPLQAAGQGDLRPLVANILSALGTFSFSGDSLVTYNLPGRPIFDPLASLFFYGGILLCLYRWREPAYAFLLLWLAAGMLPTLVLGEYTSTLHSKAAEAPIMTLPALCAFEVGRFVAARFGSSWARIFAAACVAWLAVITAFTGRDYFIRWGESPQTRAAYFHNLAAITDYLNDTEYSGVVTLSSPFPDLPLDPFIADMRVHRDDVSLRWCDARRAVVLPGTMPGLFILPSNTPLDPYFADRLGLQRIERVHLRSDDVTPYFDVFEWAPHTALSRFPSPAPGTAIAGGEPLPLPVNFGAVELVAYDLAAPGGLPGDTVALVTVWRIRDPAALGPPPAHDYGHAAVAFVHALDAAGTIVGQEDRLDAPAWNWHAGDAFVQLHRFQVAADAPPGPYHLEVGLYTRQDLTRLPVLVNGDIVDDHILLPFGETMDQ
ncbi:MAG: glycosyltransferase family 39 protein [Chloroflexota bacterium]|nr:glycosyltransferase family 39 protein [Chloroflexota bacterium]